jgi:hypothetical protein
MFLAGKLASELCREAQNYIRSVDDYIQLKLVKIFIPLLWLINLKVTVTMLICSCKKSKCLKETNGKLQVIGKGEG